MMSYCVIGTISDAILSGFRVGAVSLFESRPPETGIQRNYLVRLPRANFSGTLGFLGGDVGRAA